MKITKFVHSCILVEDDGQAVLFDPGVFSWNSGLVNVDELPELDSIVCTHKHGDHMAEPFIKALVERFPDVQWFAPSDVLDKLKDWGVANVTNQSQGDFDITEIDHAKVAPWGEDVRDLIVHWKGKVTHPGDTHEIPETMPILLLPVDAPWGMTARAYELPGELKPKHVIPIHDFMWNDQWRTSCYKRLGEGCAEHSIDFISPTDGQPIEISI